MVWFIKTFWKSISFGTFLLGLLFVPSDISDVPNALSGWRRIFAMFDITTALAIFSAFAMAYIIYIDARPFLSRWQASRRKGLRVQEEIWWQCGRSEEYGGVRYYPNVAHLIVFNAAESGRTFENVRVRAGTLEMRELVDRLTGAKEVSLNSGEHAEFVLGRVVSKRMFGGMDMAITMEESDKHEAEHNAANGQSSIRLNENTHLVLMLGASQATTPRAAPLSISVTAKDQPAIRVRLMIDPEKLSSTAPDGGNPFTATTDA